ncbi:hypothetical protein BH11ARM2_BH11ARM2_10400 [soil metagenome]
MNESQLDALLSRWADQNRLSEAKIEAIRAIPRPELLPKAWWKAQFRIAQTILEQTTDPRRLASVRF